MQGLVGFVGYFCMLPHEHPWCFVQEMVPSLVNMSEDVREPAYTWDRYQLAPDDRYRNKQERVLAEFWVSLSRTTFSLGKSFIEIMNGYIGFV